MERRPRLWRGHEDVIALADEARARFPDDDLRAVHWVLYEWRSKPDAWERDLLSLAAGRIVTSMHEETLTRWRSWVALPPNERPSLTSE